METKIQRSRERVKKTAETQKKESEQPPLPPRCARNRCGIDIETKSSADLTKTGVHRYVEDPDFAVTIITYRKDGKDTQIDSHSITDPAHDPRLEELRSVLADPRIIKTAFNAPFERTCLAKWLGMPMPPEQWECTMVKALTLGLPASLADVGTALGLPEEQLKDPRGGQLIRFFSQPCDDGSFRRPEDYPGKWQEYLAYNRQDVETEQAIYNRLCRYVTTEEEQKLWELDQIQNDRGICVDIDMARQITDYDNRRKEELMEQARELTGLANPNSLAKLKQWCADEGYPMSSITKDTIAAALNDINTPSRVREALEIRQATGKASVAKYTAMENAVCQEGRLRGILQFYGANRSGRWAGRIVQTHNLAKNSLPDIGLARELVKAGRFDELDTLFGEPAFVFSELVRTAFVPSPGHLFAVSDFSAIEARVLAWLSGEEWVLEAFRGGKDIYCETASNMYHVPVGKHGPNAELRAKGKVAVLACGYQGGVGAMKRMDRGGKIPEDELQSAVDQWRAANSHTVALWREAEKAAKTAIRRRGYARLTECIDMEYRDGILFIRLPSGRRLAYWDAQIRQDNVTGREQITYAGTNPETHRWERAETYGGKIVENITQAVARDCLADAMMRVAARGYEVAMHIHDEMVVDVPAPNGEEDAKRALDEINDIMSVPPAWAKDLPLKGAGYVTPYYIKD